MLYFRYGYPHTSDEELKEMEMDKLSPFCKERFPKNS